MSKWIESQVTRHPFFTLALIFLIPVALVAATLDRNVGTPAPAFVYKQWTVAVAPEPYSEAAADKATWTPNAHIGTVWVTDFDCSYRAKNGTVSATAIMLEKNGTNMLTAGVDLGAGTAATLIPATLTPTPFSLTSSDKATIDVDTFTGGGTMAGIICNMTYRTLVGAEAVQ